MGNKEKSHQSPNAAFTGKYSVFSSNACKTWGGCRVQRVLLSVCTQSSTLLRLLIGPSLSSNYQDNPTNYRKEPAVAWCRGASGGLGRRIAQHLRRTPKQATCRLWTSSIIAIAQKIPGKVYEETRRHAVTRNALWSRDGKMQTSFNRRQSHETSWHISCFEASFFIYPSTATCQHIRFGKSNATSPQSMDVFARDRAKRCKVCINPALPKHRSFAEVQVPSMAAVCDGWPTTWKTPSTS